MDKPYFYATDFTDTSVPVEKKIQASIIFFFRKRRETKSTFILKVLLKETCITYFKPLFTLKQTRIFSMETSRTLERCGTLDWLQYGFERIQLFAVTNGWQIYLHIIELFYLPSLRIFFVYWKNSVILPLWTKFDISGLYLAYSFLCLTW